jgi:hypothetical protein
MNDAESIPALILYIIVTVDAGHNISRGDNAILNAELSLIVRKT